MGCVRMFLDGRAIIRVQKSLRSVAFPAAADGLFAVHRHLRRADGAFHVKDAEFHPSGRQGVYSGFQPGSTGPGVPVFGRWASGFRRRVLAAGGAGYDRWAVLEVGVLIKHPEDGAPRGRGLFATP